MSLGFVEVAHIPLHDEEDGGGNAESDPGMVQDRQGLSSPSASSFFDIIFLGSISYSIL